jgi:hypothetical protein
MDIMVEFNGGGPLDGKVLAAGENPEFDLGKANWVLGLAVAGLNIAARREERPGTLLIWRAPSPEMAERAKAEQWSEAKVAALMRYYEYHITSFEETEGLVMFKAYYRGVT